MVKSATVQGIPASPGIAQGEVRVIYSFDTLIRRRSITDDEVAQEIRKVDEAVEKTIAELSKIRESAGKSLGGPATKIFDAQLLIAGDFEFIKSVKDGISRRKLNAETVYSDSVEQSMEPLNKSKDEYMRQMMIDIQAVSAKVLAHLAGDTKQESQPLPENTIVVAKKLTPAETLQLSERGVAGVITAEGSSHSHMALIARSLNLPAVVGVDRIQNRVRNGARIIVDGGAGKIYIQPSDSIWEGYKSKQGGDALSAITQLSELACIPPKTTDGHVVELAANIELPGSRDAALAKRGVGVGLYRTEFIYLQSSHFPGEEDQFKYYDTIAKEYAPQKVVMRTFDLGSDKFVEELQSIKEDNPALGYRGIRMSLGMPAIFKTQLRALLRATARKNVKILLPMLSDISELVRAERAIKRVMVELRREKIEFDPDVEIGVMIETPSAALTAGCFAERAAFLAIGTNDLLQYTMAVDRDNNRVAELYRILHPSALELIARIITEAKAHKRPVSICGEMASDPAAAPLLVGMGADALSMDPTKLYGAARIISALSLDEMKAFATKMLQAKTLKETEKLSGAFAQEVQRKIMQ